MPGVWLSEQAKWSSGKEIGHSLISYWKESKGNRRNVMSARSPKRSLRDSKAQIVGCICVFNFVFNEKHFFTYFYVFCLSRCSQTPTKMFFSQTSADIFSFFTRLPSFELCSGHSFVCPFLAFFPNHCLGKPTSSCNNVFSHSFDTL